MFDAGFRSERAPAVLQRATGALRLRLKTRDGQTVLGGLRQEGCLKARFPRPERGGWVTAVTLNISGGVAAGDRLDTAIEAGQGTEATIAAQAAERFYRAAPGSRRATVRTRVDLVAGARIEWLPQDTILFDGCAMDRELCVTMDDTGWFLGVETLVFGRAAMGEQVHRAVIRDVIRIERAGRPVLHDVIRFEGDVAAVLTRTAVAAGARAVATLVLAAPDSGAALETVRAAFAGAPGEWGVSAWDGLLVARGIARGAAPLRSALVPTLALLRHGRPLPRVWLC